MRRKRPEGFRPVQSSLGLHQDDYANTYILVGPGDHAIMLLIEMFLLEIL